jgi:hypothetical protein
LPPSLGLTLWPALVYPLLGEPAISDFPGLLFAVPTSAIWFLLPTWAFASGLIGFSQRFCPRHFGVLVEHLADDSVASFSPMFDGSLLFGELEKLHFAPAA